MPRFITFFSYTAESAKAMIDRPSDRSAAARALTESLGGTMEAFYEQTAIVQQAATARNAYKPPTA
jgi:uncharacterized protein with GYD domain